MAARRSLLLIISIAAFACAGRSYRTYPDNGSIVYLDSSVGPVGGNVDGTGVTMHYKGVLDGGKVFDSSYDKGVPATMSVGGVIKGVQEGLQLIGEGGMIELEIPATLAYGKKGSRPAIPPDAKLHFIIELVDVN